MELEKQIRELERIKRSIVSLQKDIKDGLEVGIYDPDNIYPEIHTRTIIINDCMTKLLNNSKQQEIKLYNDAIKIAESENKLIYILECKKSNTNYGHGYAQDNSKLIFSKPCESFKGAKKYAEEHYYKSEFNTDDWSDDWSELDRGIWQININNKYYKIRREIIIGD